MAYRYFQSRVKQKQHKIKKIKSITIFFIAVILLFCLISPQQFGIVGKKFKEWFSIIFGQAMFLVPVFLAFYSWQLLKYKKAKPQHIILSISLILLISSFLNIIGKFYKTNYGGWTGKFLGDNIFERLFGGTGSIFVVVIGILYLITLLFNISLSEIIGFISNRIKKDLEEWKKTSELNKKIKSLPESEKIIKVKPEPLPEIPGEPKIVVEKKPGIKPRVEEKIEKQKVEYKIPSVDLLRKVPGFEKKYEKEEMRAKAKLLEETLASFNVFAKVIDITPGPVVTRFDLEPASGVKVQSITARVNDISLAMKTSRLHIIAPVPGKAAIGIEIPNPEINIVGLREIVMSEKFQNSKSKLTIGLGKTSTGEPYVADLETMPHLLIAGATGSGKSVCIHSIISSILFKSKPDEVKFLLIDPKRLELPTYNDLPHLYDPKVPAEKAGVVTQAKQASRSLQYLVKIMEKRYEKFAQATVRNIEGYNALMEKKGQKKEFYIVVIIDELADLMLTIPKEVEDAVQRLAQMARAVGIHLVLATQRPSVDVITGVIKANLSSRIAFQVLSKIDSRVILDVVGAEDLLGRGDMLFLPTGEPQPIRLQGAYLSEKDIEAVVGFIRQQGVKPEYEDDIVKTVQKEQESKEDETKETYLKQALVLIKERKRVSQDLLKAHFGSSARASDVLSLLEVRGFIVKPEGTNRWQILFDKIDEYMEPADEN